MGLFYRTIRMIDNGIKPVYVFDGKPPQMKSGEVSLFVKIFYVSIPKLNFVVEIRFQLAKRKERREEAQKQLEKAEETG